MSGKFFLDLRPSIGTRGIGLETQEMHLRCTDTADNFDFLQKMVCFDENVKTAQKGFVDLHNPQITTFMHGNGRFIKISSPKKFLRGAAPNP